MSHIATPYGHRYPWYARLLFRLQRRNYGQVLEPARLWGRMPRVFLAMSAMYGTLDRKSSPLAPALRSLVQVRVSRLNGCSFCADINSASGMRRGVAPEKLLVLHAAGESPLFTEQEKVALLHAETMTGNRGDKEAVMARLRQHFSDDAIVELTALIAFQNMSSRFNAALGVPAQGFCAVHMSPGPKS